MLQHTVPEASCNKVHLMLFLHQRLFLSRVIKMVLISEKIFSGRGGGLGCGCDLTESACLPDSMFPKGRKHERHRLNLNVMFSIRQSSREDQMQLV